MAAQGTDKITDVVVQMCESDEITETKNQNSAQEIDKYCGVHKVELVKTEYTEDEDIVVQLSKSDKIIEINIQNPKDHKFHFAARVDPAAFETINKKLSLGKKFEDFGTYLIELLQKATAEKSGIEIKISFINEPPLMKINENEKIIELDLVPTGPNQTIQELSCGLKEMIAKCTKLQEVLKSVMN